MLYRVGALRAVAVVGFGVFGLGCSGDMDEPPGPGAGASGGWAGAAGSGAGMAGGGISGAGSGGVATGGGAGVAGNAGASGVAGSMGGTGAGGTATGGAGTGGLAGGGAAGAGAGGVAGSMAGADAGGTAGATGGAGSGGVAGTSGTAGAAGAAECVEMEPPAPPAEMQETIDITWDEMTGELSGTTGARGSQRAIQNYPSWTLDHVMWSGGSLNFCVRWDSEQPVSETLRDQVADALQRGVDAWFDSLAGYDCFPYDRIAVNITGWATRNRATFQWADDNFAPLFINQLSEGAPDCPNECSRNRHQDADYEFPDCEGGFDARFDQEVWLTEDYGSPNGWDFGQHVDREGFTNRVTGALYHIWLHEFGHGIGFPDYYDWAAWAPGIDAPRCVMNAGAATTVTEWDQWMFKRTWSELRRMGRWD